VYLVLDRPQYTEFDAHYFPAYANPVARLSEPKNYRAGNDPPDVTVLCAELPCSVGDHWWTATDAELGDTVAHALEWEGLPPPRAVQVEVRRLPRVYPVYRVGFERHLAALETWAAEQPRLVTFGRQGLFVPDNTHHALAMGAAAADALRPDGSFDTARWTAARDGFRTHVVED
jgi:protoporphyrinogen oxidase